MSSKSINSHNWSMQRCAKEFASSMQMSPSPLEEKMMEFLDKYNFYYVTQKIFYITKDNGYIEKFFIADFYFPDLKIILETDGQFHKKQVKKDAKRTELITSNYPDIKILRWEWNDFNDSVKVDWLLSELHYEKKISNENEHEKHPVKHSLAPTETFFFTYPKEINHLCHCKIFDVNIRVLWKLMEFAEYNSGKVYMNSDRVSQVLDSCDISKSSYYRAIKILKENSVIEGENNTFSISPNLFWKGDRITRDRLAS